jgi:hypothetical protein
MSVAERIIAIDWSGNASASGQRRHIWSADLQGNTIDVSCDRTRLEICRWLIAERKKSPNMVVGLDFAFSFPISFFQTRGLRSVDQLWREASEHGEQWMRSCEPPFWGRPGKKCPATHQEVGFRATDKTIHVLGISPKSPFQIGGAGAVGTGSIRGFVALEILRQAGFSIWPFHPISLPLVIEIYPRLLTGPVQKSRHDRRTEYLRSFEFAWLPETVRLKAESSEDAFDALLSGITMKAQAASFTELTQATDPRELLEGKIWDPATSRVHLRPPSPLH